MSLRHVEDSSSHIMRRTRSASAGVYLEKHVANLRLGMVLELFSASGALVGGLIAFMLPANVLEGLFAALLGIGAGIVKVPTMHLLMGVPLKIATATSNMMIGITAVSSAVIYLLRGQIDPFVAGPTAVGVFAGAMIGTRIAHRVDVRVLRWLFVVVLAYTAFQMGLKALGL